MPKRRISTCAQLPRHTHTQRPKGTPSVAVQQAYPTGFQNAYVLLPFSRSPTDKHNKSHGFANTRDPGPYKPMKVEPNFFLSNRASLLPRPISAPHAAGYVRLMRPAHNTLEAMPPVTSVPLEPPRDPSMDARLAGVISPTTAPSAPKTPCVSPASNNHLGVAPDHTKT